MSELHRKPEVTDIPKPEASAFKEIKPETSLSPEDAKQSGQPFQRKVGGFGRLLQFL